MPAHASSGRLAEFRDVIHDLYITKRWELRKVQEHMTKEYKLDESKSTYTTQLKKWGFSKYLKNVPDQHRKIVKYKVTKARKMGKKVNPYFNEQLVTPGVLRGNGFFISPLEEAKFDISKSPKTPPGFRLAIYSREASPISLDDESGWQSIIEPPKLPVVVRTPSPMRHTVQLDNLPWFKFQARFHTFLKEQRISFPRCINDYRPQLNHQTDSSELHNYVSTIDDLEVSLSISEESTAVTYLLDVLGDQYGKDLQVNNKLRLGSIIDYLFTSQISDLYIFNTERNNHTLFSYFRPFIPERRDGELLEGISRILGPVYDGFLQFLTYTINMLSNNLLSEDDVDRIVQWIDEIQGYNLLAKLLSLKTPTIKAFASNMFPSALRLKNISLVSALLDAGTNPNSSIGYNKLRPLLYISLFGSNEIAQLLLKLGADVNAPPAGYPERTALQAASEKGNIELVRLLLNAGADVNAPASRVRGRTALQAASEKGHVELVRLLLDAGADFNAPPSYYFGVAAIQAAAIAGCIIVVQLLLNSGADVNAAGSAHGGRTALEGAAEHGRMDMLQLLINAGARTMGDRQSQYLQAVKFAEKEGRFAAAELLRNHRPWTQEDCQIFEDLGELDEEYDEADEEYMRLTKSMIRLTKSMMSDFLEGCEPDLGDGMKMTTLLEVRGGSSENHEQEEEWVNMCHSIDHVRHGHSIADISVIVRY